MNVSLVDRIDVFVQSIEQMDERTSFVRRKGREKAFFAIERELHDSVVRATSARRQARNLIAPTRIFREGDESALVQDDETPADRRFIERGAIADRPRGTARGASQLRENAPFDDADAVPFAIERRGATREFIRKMVDEGGHVPLHIEHSEASADRRLRFLRDGRR